MRPPDPRQRKGPARHTPGPNSKSVTGVVFMPVPTLLAMADRLVDDGISTTPVRSKIVVCRIAERLRRRLPVSESEVAIVQQLYRQRRDELAAAAELFAGCS